MDKLHEECGVFGVSINTSDAAGTTYNGLLALQHRGQEGAGIASLSNGKLLCHKDVGLVNEVFTDDILKNFPKSNMAIGHTRYSTTGSNSKENVQPFITEYLTGRIATAHNGNITNAQELKKFLTDYGLQFSATSDSEIVSSLIAFETLNEGDILTGVINATKKLKGAFSLITISSQNKLIAVRDPNGFRPLCLGENEYGMVVASESCALDSCGFDYIRDIKPGEIVVIEDGKITYSEQILKEKRTSLCIFEYVYFSRPDSIIDNQSVYEARYNMGKTLAKEHPVEADVVCGVPDSGLEAAMGYSAQSGIRLVSGFVKNRYIGRSFIYPMQSQRENAVSLKLNPLKANINGKRIVLVDDSIVRGTTSAKIIKALREMGAKEIHMRISAPPFVHTCHFGTDIDSEENLIANKMSLEDICKKIGADSLGFISLNGLKESCDKSNLNYCTGCFNGDYGSDYYSNINNSKLQLEGV